MVAGNSNLMDQTFGPIASRTVTPVSTTTAVRSPTPSDELSAEAVSHLEELDDVIFAAIAGDQAALQASAAAWHRAVKTLGHDAVEETRRQYLRHAQSVWEELRHQSVQPPHKIFAAIEIIGLLVNSER
jgi:hypothetical protein